MGRGGGGGGGEGWNNNYNCMRCNHCIWEAEGIHPIISQCSRKKMARYRWLVPATDIQRTVNSIHPFCHVSIFTRRDSEPRELWL